MSDGNDCAAIALWKKRSRPSPSGADLLLVPLIGAGVEEDEDDGAQVLERDRPLPGQQKQKAEGAEEPKLCHVRQGAYGNI